MRIFQTEEQEKDTLEGTQVWRERNVWLKD